MQVFGDPCPYSTTLRQPPNPAQCCPEFARNLNGNCAKAARRAWTLHGAGQPKPSHILTSRHVGVIPSRLPFLNRDPPYTSQTSLLLVACNKPLIAGCKECNDDLQVLGKCTVTKSSQKPSCFPRSGMPASSQPTVVCCLWPFLCDCNKTLGSPLIVPRPSQCPNKGNLSKLRCVKHLPFFKACIARRRCLCPHVGRTAQLIDPVWCDSLFQARLEAFHLGLEPSCICPQFSFCHGGRTYVCFKICVGCIMLKT